MFISLWRAGVILLWVGFKVIVLLLSCPACRLVCVCEEGGGHTICPLYSNNCLAHAHTDKHIPLVTSDLAVCSLESNICVFYSSQTETNFPFNQTWVKDMVQTFNRIKLQNVLFVLCVNSLDNLIIINIRRYQKIKTFYFKCVIDCDKQEKKNFLFACDWWETPRSHWVKGTGKVKLTIYPRQDKRFNFKIKVL